MKTAKYSFLLLSAALLMAAASAYAADDNRIEAAAKDSYVFKNYLKDDHVKVDAHDNGVVTLTGTVANENNKSLAENTVEKLPGVSRVDNQLEVKGEHYAAGSDGWLGMKVKTALLFHSKVNPMKTHVNVQDGIVTLTGDVENQARKDLATEYAKDVDGVKEVKNDMNVIGTDAKDDMKEAKADADKIRNDAKADAREVRENAKEEAKAIKADARDDYNSSKENVREERARARDNNDDRYARNDDDHYRREEHVDDASISAQAKMALFFHRSTSGLSTKVDTHDGVVTLTGKAKTDAEKDLATKLVSDIRGVKNVDNQMDVVGENK